MLNNMIFFFKLGLVLYLIVAWIKITCGYLDQNNDKIQESQVVVRVGGQVPCKQVCQQKYSQLLGSSSSDSWIPYMNSAETKNTAIKQIDQLADYYKQISLNYAKSTLKFNDSDYRISLFDVGCFFKKQDNFFECFDAQLNSKQLRTTKGSLNISLWKIISKFLQQEDLHSVKLPIILNFFKTYLKKYIPETILFALVAFAWIIRKWRNKQENQETQINYGLRMINYLKNDQNTKIINKDDNQNRLQFKVKKSIKDKLNQVSAKKIKLIIQSSSGIGLTSNVQAWCQQKVLSQEKDVIYYKLDSKITDNLLTQTHLYNINAIFDAIIERNNDVRSIIWQYQQNITSSILKQLDQISYWPLIIGTILTAYNCSYLIQFFIFVIFGKKMLIYARFILEGFINFVYICLAGSQISNNKIIVIQNIELLRDIQMNLLKKLQLVRNRNFYDVILISQNRIFSDKLIQNIDRQNQNLNVQGYQQIKFQSSLIQPLSFYQIQNFLYERTISVSLKNARYFGFFTVNTKQIARGLGDSDKKHSRGKGIPQKFTNKFKQIFNNADQKLRKAKEQQQINKYLNENHIIGINSANIQEAIDTIYKKNREELNKDLNDEQKKTDLWKTIDYINDQPEYVNLQDKLIIVYRWYKQLELKINQINRYQCLENWLQKRQAINKFMNQDHSNEEIIKLTIKYLNQKQILINGDFANISYAFQQFQLQQSNQIINSLLDTCLWFIQSNRATILHIFMSLVFAYIVTYKEESFKILGILLDCLAYLFGFSNETQGKEL